MLAIVGPSGSGKTTLMAFLMRFCETRKGRVREGYNTVADERGSLLSGGEHQRVAIARALLKNRPILILDKATPALDAESEELVQRAIERLMAGRTTFVIVHQLVTVTNADRIIVLQSGKIAEVGPHRELPARGGYYASLVRRQSLGLIANDAA